MISRLWILTILPLAAIAQDPPPGPTQGSIAGTVADSGTNAPMAEVDVYINRGSPKELHAVTDAQGHYAIRGIDAGQYRVSANAPSPIGRGFGASATRQVSLAAGQELASIDFHLVSYASLSGKVVDQNNEPVPGLQVLLVSREYSGGVLRAFFVGASFTDDRGEYHLERVTPGRANFVQARRRASQMEPISNAPLEPRLRRPAVIPTFYPNGANMESGQALVLRPGEHREGVDIHLVRSPSYCVEAVVEGSSGPSDLQFNITEGQPTSGSSGDGGFYTTTPGGSAGADGKLRVCDLHPGQYELSATEYGSEPRSPISLFGAVMLNVVDQDLKGIRVQARPRISVPGEVAWDGAAPSNPDSAQISISLQSITRAGALPSANAQLPGEFTLAGLLIDEYSMRFGRVPTGMYIKDVTYGGHSILNQTLKPGSATADPSLRVLVARDGGTLNARVTDKDGNPVGDTPLVVMPASADSEAMLAATMLTGRTDQFGAYASSTLPPGKYYVVAPVQAVDKSPESVGRLWRARTAAYEVTVPAGGAGSASLAPKSIE